VAKSIPSEPTLLRLMQNDSGIDNALPAWARRSNPIVRRQLGIYWKTLPLEVSYWLRVVGIEIVIVIVAVFAPALYTFIMPVVTVSVLLIPFVFYTYGQVLFRVATQAANAAYDELHNHTLALLLVTPLPHEHILLSKLAASIWRQADNLSLVIIGHILLSLPVLILQYATIYSPEDTPVVTSLAVILAMLASLARLVLEPLLVGAIGIVAGVTTAPRILTNIIAVTVAAAYFVFINLPRLLDLSFEARLLVDIVLPLVLPGLLAYGLLRLAGWLLSRD
jgi:hypothetical protein